MSTRRVRLKAPWNRAEGNLGAGDVADMPEDQAKAWIAAGQAEDLTPVRAPRAAPETAARRAPETRG